MFDFDFAHIATATVGAFVLAVTSISAAVGPARAVETAPVAYAVAQVQSSAVLDG